MLRKFDGKPHGILIDHVGNVDHMIHTYNLQYPHDDPMWTLDDYKKFQVNDDGKSCESRVCSDCFNRYTPKSNSDVECPECHHVETAPEQLDTLKKLQATECDLVPMTVDFIDRLLAERKKVDKSELAFKNSISTMPHFARVKALANHQKRNIAQVEFRALYDKYCYDLWMTGKYDVTAVQQQFEIDYGVNMLKAQVLSAPETTALIIKMKKAS